VQTQMSPQECGCKADMSELSIVLSQNAKCHHIFFKDPFIPPSWFMRGNSGCLLSLNQRVCSHSCYLSISLHTASRVW